MSLIIICGFPSCGKSRTAAKLMKVLEEKQSKSCADVRILTDQSMFGALAVASKNDIYDEAKLEKRLRDMLKSEVQRLLSANKIVIVDSLNYIKSFRYELYCVAKSAQATYCVIHCDIDPAVAKQWNYDRDPLERYNQNTFDALVQRFEEPQHGNRWDSPLFVIHTDQDEALPQEQLSHTIFRTAPPKRNQSTAVTTSVSAPSNALPIEAVTSKVIKSILEQQKCGYSLTIDGASSKIELQEPVSMAQLQRIRREFLQLLKTQSPDSRLLVTTETFVQFLNNSLGR